MIEQPTRRGVYAYGLAVELRQPVTLVRDPSISATLAETWSVGGVGVVGWDALSKLRGQISDSVDQFINAYLSVNSAPMGSGATSAPPRPATKQNRR